MKVKDKAYNLNQKFIIAMDGPSGSGKGAIGNLIAKKYSMFYFQSSLLYRFIAYQAIEANINLSDTKKLIKLSESEELEKIIELINNIDLQTEKIGDYTSKMSVIPELRSNITKKLQKIITLTPRIIMEGRDITTVVAPQADLKLFITANLKTRAERRFKQLQSEGKKCIFSDVYNLMKERDERDQNRISSPLSVTKDSIVIDTSSINLEEVVNKIENIIDNSQ